MSYKVEKVSPRIAEIGYYRKGNRAEEELVSHIDDEDAEYLKRGHKCLISINPMSLDNYQTTYRQDYKKQWHDKKKIGIKKDLMERFVYDKIMRKHEENANFDVRPVEVHYKTETRDKFNAANFDPKRNLSEVKKLSVSSTTIPATFWNEHRKSIPKTKIGNNMSLKRSTYFSKPMEERLDEKYL